MNRYFATDALLPAGWRRDVTIDVTDGGDIAAVGVSTSQPREAVRLAGPVMPGMANLHSHAFQRAMAGLTEVRESPSDDFWSWRELMYRFVARLTPELAHDVARHLYVEMLRNGYTAVAEFHYVHNDADGQRYADDAQMLLAHLTAAREAGLAATMLPVLYRWSNFGCKPLQPRQRRFDTDPARVLAMVDAVRREASRDPDVRAGVAPHSLRAVDPGSLRELLAGIAAIDASAPVHVHAAEQVREVDDCIAATGLRPVEWLLATQPVDARWCLVHATQMTAQETDALARSGAIAGLCPSTEGNLGDGVFPLLAYRAAGGRYGIGGDSHVSRDPVEELRLLEYVQRLLARRRNLVVGETSAAVGTTLWSETAAAGAQALGRPMGAIAAGCRADLLVLDAAAPDLAGRSGDAIANALVFCGEPGLVRDVMVGGRWVVRDRVHPLHETSRAAFGRAVRRLLD